MSHASSSPASQHASTVSVVIPVYKGERTLPKLLEEIEPLTRSHHSPAGRTLRVTDVILVHDGAVDRSDATMQVLADRYAFVKLIWLSKNYGQHPATLAGMASATGDWVATMDEDGMHDPGAIGGMLDMAMMHEAQLVYAKPTNKAPHGWLRNACSACIKHVVLSVLGYKSLGQFNSFRLIDGEIARSLAAYCGNSVYLDIALFWVVGRIAHFPVKLRHEGRRSGYSLRTLVPHFWRLVLTSGTRPLRFIQVLGALCVLLSVGLMGYALYVKFIVGIPVQGWASIVIVTAAFSGCILLSLSIIAEYLAVALNIAMGKPLYLIVSRPPRHGDRKP
jgi:polyisoprenyl-phosphate glycosyltransferase